MSGIRQTQIELQAQVFRLDWSTEALERLSEVLGQAFVDFGPAEELKTLKTAALTVLREREEARQEEGEYTVEQEVARAYTRRGY